MKQLSTAARFAPWFLRAILVVTMPMGFLAIASASESTISRHKVVVSVGIEPLYAQGAGQDTSKDTSKQETNKNAAPAQAEATPTHCAEADQLRKDLQRLNGEVQRLRKKVADLEKDHLVSSIQEQLTKEEVRAEGLQLRLREIAEKEAGLQTRMDQVNQQLQPENINATLAGVGSLRPEELRDEARRRLTNEKQRIQAQLDLLHQERARIQSSLVSSDAAIQRLHARLNEATKH